LKGSRWNVDDRVERNKSARHHDEKRADSLRPLFLCGPMTRHRS